MKTKLFKKLRQEAEDAFYIVSFDPKDFKTMHLPKYALCWYPFSNALAEEILLKHMKNFDDDLVKVEAYLKERQKEYFKARVKQIKEEHYGRR
jgi:hypothetical protein